MSERKEHEHHHHRHEHKRERERDQQHDRRSDTPRAHYPTPPQFRYPQHFNPQSIYQNQGHHHGHQHGSYSNFDYRHGGDLRRYQQQHFRNPYDGMNNFWRDRYEDNYYYDGYGHGHRHHHHHHKHKDDFFPRLLESIVGGILSGSLAREIDKLDRLDLDGKQIEDKKKTEVTNTDDIDRGFRRASREDFTPDQQILLSLDLHSQTPDGEVNPRFERTG